MSDVPTVPINPHMLPEPTAAELTELMRRQPLEQWRKTWRNGIVPLLSMNALRALKEALQKNDARLVTGCTTLPSPMPATQDWPVEASCALGYCGWQGEGLETVGEVEEFFARMCFECDQKLGEPAGVRWFLNWFDETPREEMRKQLLPEVQLAINALLYRYLENPTSE
jgi:hypothetical protein